jgi:hypothetical protein
MSGITVPSPHEARRHWPSFRASRLRWPEWLVGLGAVGLLISLVGLSWYTLHPVSGGLGPKFLATTSEDGWNGLSHAHWLVLVTILLALLLFFSQAMRRAPAVPVTLSLAVMVLAVLSTLWLIVRVPVDPPGGAGRDFGAWLGLVSAAVLTWAGYSSVRMEGIDPQDGPREIPTVSSEEIAAQQASASGGHS